jgi:Bacterial membrane protein YfhO
MSTKSADPTPEFMESGTPPAVGRLKWTRLRVNEVLCLGLLTCLNVAFFAEVLFTPRTFFVRDVSTFHYPLKKLVTEAYAQGEWPLWNPYIQMGQPLLANPNSMAVYPGQLLFQFLPFETAFELHFVVHCILAGMGAFCLARMLNLSLQAAFLSAAIYNFSGLTLSAVNLFNILPVVAFLPWLTTALLWLTSRPSVACGCFTALLLGSFFLLLEPLSTLTTALFLFVLVGAFIWKSGQVSSSWLRLSGIILMLLLAALLIAAVQIVPTLELVQFSGRKGGLGFSEATFWSLHPVQLLQTLCPKILGEYFHLEAPVPWAARFFDQREPYLLSCYVGGMTLLLAAWGAWRTKCDWRTRSLVAAMVSSILLALGRHTPVYSGLFEWVPIFRYGRFPVKFLFAANLGLALLAGTGWASLQSSEDPSRSRGFRRRGIMLLLTLSVVLTALYGESAWRLLGAARTAVGEFQWSGGSEPVTVGADLVFSGLRHIHLHLGMFAALLLLRSWSAVRPNVLGVAVLLAVLLDLWSANLWINPPGDSRLYETAPVAQYLQKRSKADGPFRIYRFEPPRLSEHPSIRYETDSVIWISLYRKLTLFPFLAAKDHIAYSLFPSVDRLETPLIQQLNHELEKSTALSDRLRLLSGLNVRYIVSPVELANEKLSLEALFRVNSDQPLRLYALNGFARRAFIVSTQPELANASSVDSQSQFPKSNGQNRPGLELDRSLNGSSVKVTKYSNGKVDLEVESPQAGLLVLMDNDYPGWMARVDAEQRPIQAIYPACRAVAIPAGKHKVAFSYEPLGFRWGLRISVIALLLVSTTLGTCLIARSVQAAKPVSQG